MENKAELSLRNDPFIVGLLQRVPKDIQNTFSNEQLLALKVALGARKWGVHPIDIRHSAGFWRWRYYFVFIAGKEKRALTSRQRKAFRMVEVLFITGFLFVSTMLGLAILYMLKSALGIDLLPDTHLGLWQWLKINLK